MNENCLVKSKQSFSMSKDVIEKCNFLVNRYCNYKYKKHKEKTRNELYSEMRGYLVSWINSMLKSWRISETSNEVLSQSWFAFIYCLDNYKQDYNISVEKHFYVYTRYFLLHNYAKKEYVHISLDELKGILNQFPTPENQHFERLLTLYQFRDVISEKTKSIWDDAMCCINTTGGNNVVKPQGFSETAYYATRKSYVNIIKLILGIKNIQEDKDKTC